MIDKNEELNSNDIIDILNKNFDFLKIETEYGMAVGVSDIEAFLYSNITGSGYLDNPIFPFTPKGLLHTLSSAISYKPVAGIFDKNRIFHSPYYLNEQKNYLFDGRKKYILPVEFEDEYELQTILNSIYQNTVSDNSNIKNTDILIQRIETSKFGNGLEPFLEYVACKHFKDKGFIVENQIPLLATVGSPDFGGYMIDEEYILKKQKNGFFLIELSLLRYNDDFEINLNKEEFISQAVGEAKTSTLVMEEQLEKYVNTGFFDYAYEIHPSKEISNNPYFGSLYLDSQNIIQLNPSKFSLDTFGNRNDKALYEKWLRNYAKLYLIANLTNDQLKKLLLEYHYGFDTFDNLIEFISRFSMVEIYTIVKEII